MLDSLEKISTILAVLGAGAWAYYHYFRGRTFKPRLQVELTAEIVRSAQSQHIVAAIGLRNLGLSVARIDQKGSGLIVCTPGTKPHHWEIYVQDWDEKDAAAFAILQGHSQIEPGLTIHEEMLITVPFREPNIFLLECVVVAHDMRWSTRTVAVEDRRSNSLVHTK